MKNPLMSFGYFKHHTVQHNGQFAALIELVLSQKVL